MGYENARLQKPLQKLADLIETCWKFLFAAVGWAGVLVQLILNTIYVTVAASRQLPRRLSYNQMIALGIPHQMVAAVLAPTLIGLIATMMCLFVFATGWPEEYTKLLPILILVATILRLVNGAIKEQDIASQTRTYFPNRAVGYPIFCALVIADFITLCVLLPVVFAGIPLTEITSGTLQETAQKILGVGSIPTTVINLAQGSATVFDLVCLAILILFFSTVVRFIFRFEVFQRTATEDAMAHLLRATWQHMAGERVTGLAGTPPCNTHRPRRWRW